MQIVEQALWKDRVLTVTWDDSPTLPPREQITQASAVCIADNGRIVLVGGGNDEWSLPGGHLEPGESLDDALMREIAEEACAIVERCVYLGAQRVDDPDRATPYFQTRWWARVRLEPFAPQYETTVRSLVSPDEFVSRLNWDTSRIARAVLDAALTAEARYEER
jgi:ADP-ribose pyrophosphatase YjhB (NUDIX family)